MKTRLLSIAALLGIVLTTTACGTIYSRQYYGSPGTQTVTAGESTSLDVFANLGQPNSIHELQNGGKVFVYKYADGKNILGLYSRIKREDTVVIMDSQGNVQWVARVNVGTGETFLSSPLFDATHPVRTETLLFEPENYGYNLEN